MSTLPREHSDSQREFSWEDFVAALNLRIARAQFESWLDRLHCRSFDDDCVRLTAPSRFIGDWVESHYRDQIVEASGRVDGTERALILDVETDGEARAKLPALGELRKAIRLRTPLRNESNRIESNRIESNRIETHRRETGAQRSDARTPDPRYAHDAVDDVRPGPRPASFAPPESDLNAASLEFFQSYSDFHLNEDYSFDNFVTGSCNELAAAAARAVAEFPGGRYNPLFIHGASGLGKTHLLQAICREVLRSDRPRRVLYLSCENFVNQFIQSVTNGDLEAFRYKYRKVDMLLIDDIQFLENKSRTQEEFFHTFNTLYNSQRQIVLSSDRPPSAIETLQERLVSRFRWGMVTMVETPAVETRIAILRRKARLWGAELDNEVAQFLAESVDTNIRELEGAVTKVIAHAELVGRKLDLQTAMEALRDLLPARAPVSVQEIIEVVAQEFRVQPKELQSKRRIQSVVLPRQVGMYLSRKHTRMSLEEIGGFFGGRDHSTVLHSVRKIEGLLPKEPELSDRVNRLAGGFGRA